MRSRNADTARDSSSVRPGASPTQNGMVGGRAVRILDVDLAGLHLEDAVGRIAELEHVARHALEGEVLAQRADAQSPPARSTTS